jgi:cobalt/nickel transport system permease protein
MLDHFAAAKTPVHRLDPSAKTVALLATILGTVLVGRDHFVPLVPMAAALATYHALGRTPLVYTLKRLLVVSPFALAVVVLFPILEPGRPVWTLTLGSWTLIATAEGLVRAGHIACKFILCAWASLLLLATTRFQDVLQGLTRLRAPRPLVTQLAFLYRYLWVLMDEVMRMRMARTARDGGCGGPRVRVRSRAGLVGVLFLRTYDRAERIYWAMAARGFDGTLHAPVQSHMHPKDWAFAAGAVILGAAVVILDRWIYG